jgi:3-hydroxyisobutyrate dehydrogenase
MTRTVAVLGTGIMGAAMARNLAKAGMEVRAWNRTRERAEPLAGDGVAVADTPARAAEGADFLITMLPDAGAVAGAVSGGALSALADGGVWLQTGTVGERGSDMLARLAEEGGVPYVDAPVLGTKAPAERGQLVVLASGPEEVRERCEPVFGAIGSKTVWFGEAGAGSRLKLVVNNWVVGLVGVLSETIALSKALGVDPEAFLGTIEGGPLGLPYARAKGKMMVEEDFPASFSVRMAGKDAGLILEAASSRGLRMAVARAVAARFDETLGAGRGEEDLAAVYLSVGPERE